MMMPTSLPWFTIPYTGKGFTLAFPEPMDAQDQANMLLSLAPNAMLWWGSSGNHEGTLNYLGDLVRNHKGVGAQRVRIVMRLDEQDWWPYVNNSADLQADLQARQNKCGNAIVAIIVGNEPEPPMPGLRWRLPTGEQVRDWGNKPVLGNLSRIDLYRVGAQTIVAQLEGSGVQRVLGAYAQHGYTEDDAPDPGLHTWRELMLSAANEAHGHGVHYYGGGWWTRDPQPPDAANQYNPTAWREYARLLADARVQTVTNVNRWKHAVRFWSAFHHRPIWFDEVNVKNRAMSQVAHMEAIVGKSKLLIHARNPEGYYLGERTAMLADFASNGLGNAYPSEYILRDPRAYILVREHMLEEGYLP